VTLDASAGEAANFVDSLGQGYVVPIAPGLSLGDAIDPANTSTPVQDAIETVAAANKPEGSNGNATGTIYLPPGRIVQDTGPITFPIGAQALQIQGYGMATPEGPNSFIEITGDNAGFEFQGYWGAKQINLRGFTLKGTGQNYPAMWWNGKRGSVTPRMVNMQRVRFDDWLPERGVIHFDETNPFSCHFDSLMFASSNNGPCFRLEKGGGVIGFTQLTNIYADCRQNRSPVIESPYQGMDVDIGLLNIGGDHDQVFDVDLSVNGHLRAQFINFETKVSDTGKGVITKSGRGYMQIDHLRVNGFSGLNSVDDIYRLNNGNNFIGPIANRGEVTIQRSTINLTGSHDRLSWYLGPSSDVTDNAVSSEGKFRILDTAGSGKG